MAVKVKLRERAMKNSRLTLYLDFYPPIIRQGVKTRREFLKMYIYEKPKNAIEKNHNQNTRMIAEGILHKRQNELNKPEVYNEYEKSVLLENQKQDESFLDFFGQLVKKRKDYNRHNWSSAYQFLQNFALTQNDNELKFKNITTNFLEDFKDYLLNSNSLRSEKMGLSVNSASSYFNKIRAGIKEAFIQGYLKEDINARISSIKQVEVYREYLSVEEVNTLAKTECSNVEVKNMALFSILTGLRVSDIKGLRWENIVFNERGVFLRFFQRKTGAFEYQPASEEIKKLIGDKGNDKDFVFNDVKYASTRNAILKKWVNDAGINKKISMHNFRHTYATLQLEAGTNIYVVSKLLGHKNVSTTQIYTKVVDSLKVEAANKIKLNLEPLI